MFKPKGGATQLGKRAFEAPTEAGYVTFGVGMSTGDLNDALDSHGLFTMGAAHGEVTVAGGYGQTGGHGPFTNTYGLAVDQWKEFKVVTTDGKLVVANSQVNPDLFWALRGGGGSTFGVVIEATAKAFATPKIVQSAFAFNTTTPGVTPASYWDLNAELHRQLPALSAKGVSGYYYIYPCMIPSL
jgi:FAD/FMN-containing dehydrogenase